jgi:hypothetical protein
MNCSFMLQSTLGSGGRPMVQHLANDPEIKGLILLHSGWLRCALKYYIRIECILVSFYFHLFSTKPYILLHWQSLPKWSTFWIFLDLIPILSNILLLFLLIEDTLFPI